MSNFHEWIYKKILKEPSKKTKSKTLRLGPLFKLTYILYNVQLKVIFL